MYQVPDSMLDIKNILAGKPIMSDPKPQGHCDHLWVSNGGDGGIPRFRRNRQLSSEILMPVRCRNCNSRTWFTEQGWNSLSEKGV